MSAHVESIHQAQCFDCDWDGPARTFFVAAEADAMQHTCPADVEIGGHSGV